MQRHTAACAPCFLAFLQRPTYASTGVQALVRAMHVRGAQGCFFTRSVVGFVYRYYGPDQVTYQVNWLKCARDHHGIDVDWLGLWNERPWGTPEYVAAQAVGA